MKNSAAERPIKGPQVNGILRLITLVEDGLLVSFLLAMILIAVGQILLRNLFGIGLSWSDPLLRVLVLWVGLMGAVAASRDNKHINIEILLRFLSGKVKEVIQVIIGLLTSAICALVAYHAVRFVYLDYSAGVKSFGTFPVWIMELILPIGFSLLSLRYLLFSVNQFRRFRVDGVEN